MQPPPYQEEYTKPNGAKANDNSLPGFQQSPPPYGAPTDQQQGTPYGYGYPQAGGAIYSGQSRMVIVTTQPHMFGSALVMPIDTTPPSNVVPNPWCVIGTH